MRTGALLALESMLVFVALCLGAAAFLNAGCAPRDKLKYCICNPCECCKCVDCGCKKCDCCNCDK